MEPVGDWPGIIGPGLARAVGSCPSASADACVSSMAPGLVPGTSSTEHNTEFTLLATQHCTLAAVVFACSAGPAGDRCGAQGRQES